MLSINKWYAYKLNTGSTYRLLFRLNGLCDNMLYYKADVYAVSPDNRLLFSIYNELVDAVKFENYYIEVDPPSAAWQLLYVNKNIDSVENLDNDNECID